MGANDLDNWRIVIADNGSVDTTYSIAKQLSQQHPVQIRCIHLPDPGVGMALREAWITSNADVVGYMDLDLSTDIQHLLQIQDLFKKDINCIVNASRLLPDSNVKQRTLLREILSRGLNILMQRVLKNKFTDAMCGFKFMNRQIAISLFDTIPKIPDWFVAAELLVKAEWSGRQVIEIPINWIDDKESSVVPLKVASQYIKNIYRISRERYS